MSGVTDHRSGFRARWREPRVERAARRAGVERDAARARVVRHQRGGTSIDEEQLAPAHRGASTRSPARSPKARSAPPRRRRAVRRGTTPPATASALRTARSPSRCCTPSRCSADGHAIHQRVEVAVAERRLALNQRRMRRPRRRVLANDVAERTKAFVGHGATSPRDPAARSAPSPSRTSPPPTAGTRRCCDTTAPGSTAPAPPCASARPSPS